MRLAPLLLFLALAGCGGGSGDDNGGLSRSEARQLDEAAAAIDIDASQGNGAAE